MALKNTEREREIMTKRLEIIAPLLNNTLNAAQIRILKGEVCANKEISMRTLTRYLNAYNTNGCQGLIPKSTSRATRVIDKTVTNRAKELRDEEPSRSVATLIAIMESEHLIAPGTIKRSTLQRVLEDEGYSAHEMREKNQFGARSRRFEKTRRNELWMSDIKEGPNILINGKQTRTYLCIFVDDYSRHIVHCQFYSSAEAFIVEDSLKQAIKTHGIPQNLYVDNGRQYKTSWMKRFCALLNINLLYCKPRSPQSKGKVERLIRTISDGFLTELKHERVSSLADLNVCLHAWVNRVYEKEKHKETYESPCARYANDPTLINYGTPDILDFASKHQKTRKVNKSGEISLNGYNYYCGTEYMGKYVNIYYYTEKDESITFGYGNEPMKVITKAHRAPYVEGRGRPRKPKNVENPSNYLATLVNEENPNYMVKSSEANSPATEQSNEPDAQRQPSHISYTSFDEDDE